MLYSVAFIIVWMGWMTCLNYMITNSAHNRSYDLGLDGAWQCFPIFVSKLNLSNYRFCKSFSLFVFEALSQNFDFVRMCFNRWWIKLCENVLSQKFDFVRMCFHRWWINCKKTLHRVWFIFVLSSSFSNNNNKKKEKHWKLKIIIITWSQTEFFSNQ